MRNQNRIEGEYCIVSVYQAGRTAEENVEAHQTAIRRAIANGVPVEQLEGRYNGEYEQSLRLFGPQALNFATVLALDYGQTCFIEVSGGVAAFHNHNLDEPGYSKCETYESIVEAGYDVHEDNYSETMSGFRFRFV